MMNITRHNYEEYFLLYVDNELNIAQRKAVEEFVQQNPDLEEELIMLQQSVLRPDRHVVFTNKDSLLKNVPLNLVHESNYEEYFVLYGDNELTNAEKDLVEQFVYKHPQYQADFELIQQARVFSDNTVVYPDKNDLYRSEEDFKVVPFPWRRVAVAAAILLFLGSVAIYLASNNGRDKKDNPLVKRSTPATNPGNTTNNSAPAVTDNKKQETLAKTDIPSTPDNNKSLQNSKAVANASKNKKDGSNIYGNKYVTKKRDEVVAKNDNTPVSREKNIESRPVYAVFTGSVPANPVNIVMTKETNPRKYLKMPEIEVIYANEESAGRNEYASTASSSKSPIRGLIRKVSRVFDKATNIGDTENDKKSLRIASFEIALK